LAGLTAEDLPGIDPRLQPEMLAALALEKALASRNGYGATAPERVREQIARFETALAECRAFAGGPTGGAAFAGAKNGAEEARRR
ncbi:argininosuccinate lyase, partial [Sinorhizobium meliloti]